MNWEKPKLSKEQAETIKMYIDTAILNQDSDSALVEIIIKNCFKILGDIAHLRITTTLIIENQLEKDPEIKK